MPTNVGSWSRISVIALAFVLGCEVADEEPIRRPPPDAGGGGGVESDAGRDAGTESGPTNDCVGTSSEANEAGVGSYCTRQGDECAAEPTARFCTVDFWPDDDVWSCTLPCQDDSDCGGGAYCTTGAERPDQIRHCLPVSCR